MKYAVLLCLAAACDPMWNVHAQLRDPANRRIEGATVAVACPEGTWYGGNAGHTNRDGVVDVGSLGSVFPIDCDIYFAHEGYRTQRIRYRQLCPEGRDHCDRIFTFDIMLEPAAPQ